MRAKDVVEIRGVVIDVDYDGQSGQALVDLGRGVPRVWIPVRRLSLVQIALPKTDAQSDTKPG